MRARPSFSARTIGSRPCAARASAAGTNRPSTVLTCPSPMTVSATCASGARSPEQPRLPYSWTTGVSPADSSPAYACATSGRTPVRPVARVDSLSSIIARTTSRSTSGPEPAAWERIRLRCSLVRSSCGMWRFASAPKPVEMPYAGVGSSARASIRLRLAVIAAMASSEITTFALSRATRTTSAAVNGPMPTTTECTWIGFGHPLIVHGRQRPPGQTGVSA